jgi:hypothetical protein
MFVKSISNQAPLFGPQFPSYPLITQIVRVYGDTSPYDGFVQQVDSTTIPPTFNDREPCKVVNPNDVITLDYVLCRLVGNIDGLPLYAACDPSTAEDSQVIVEADVQCVNGFLAVYKKILFLNGGLLSTGTPYLDHWAGCCDCEGSGGSSPVPTAWYCVYSPASGTSTCVQLTLAQVDYEKSIGNTVSPPYDSQTMCLGLCTTSSSLVRKYYCFYDAQSATQGCFFWTAGEAALYGVAPNRIIGGPINDLPTCNTACGTSGSPVPREWCCVRSGGTGYPIGSCKDLTSAEIAAYIAGGYTVTIYPDIGTCQANCIPVPPFSSGSYAKQWYCVTSPDASFMQCLNLTSADVALYIVAGYTVSPPFVDKPTCEVDCVPSTTSFYCLWIPDDPSGCTASLPSDNPCNTECLELTPAEAADLADLILSGPWPSEICPGACTYDWYCVARAADNEVTDCAYLNLIQVASGDFIIVPNGGPFGTDDECTAFCGEPVIGCCPGLPTILFATVVYGTSGLGEPLCGPYPVDPTIGGVLPPSGFRVALQYYPIGSSVPSPTGPYVSDFELWQGSFAATGSLAGNTIYLQIWCNGETPDTQWALCFIGCANEGEGESGCTAYQTQIPTGPDTSDCTPANLTFHPDMGPGCCWLLNGNTTAVTVTISDT